MKASAAASFRVQAETGQETGGLEAAEFVGA
jgi:hypothetical protein